MEYKAPLFGAVTLVSGPETLLAERAVRGLTQQALAERPDASVTELEGAGVTAGSLNEATGGSLFAADSVVVIDPVSEVRPISTTRSRGMWGPGWTTWP